MLQCVAPRGMAFTSWDFGLSLGSTGRPAGSFRRGAAIPRAVRASDPHFLLGHFTVNDTE